MVTNSSIFNQKIFGYKHVIVNNLLTIKNGGNNNVCIKQS